MIHFFLKVIVGFAVFSAPAWAFARGAGSGSAVILTANAFVYNTTIEAVPGGQSKSNISIYDLKLGYLAASGIYIGGIYTARNQSGSTDEEGKSSGASLGYFGSRGFFLIGHYLLDAKIGEYEEGTGFQGDFGYLVGINGSFHVGVELTYRSIDYKKYQKAAIESHKVDQLFPMLTLGFVF